MSLVESVRRNLCVAVDLREEYGLDLPAILAALTEAEALRAQIVASQAREVATARYAAFGAWAFEKFWHDAEPGDIDGGDAQEAAVRLGLLRRRTEYDTDSPCADFCTWEPSEGPVSDCECLFPTTGPHVAPTDTEALRALLRAAWIDGIDGDDGSNSADAYVDRILGGS